MKRPKATTEGERKEVGMAQNIRAGEDAPREKSNSGRHQFEKRKINSVRTLVLELNSLAVSPKNFLARGKEKWEECNMCK